MTIAPFKSIFIQRSLVTSWWYGKLLSRAKTLKLSTSQLPCSLTAIFASRQMQAQAPMRSYNTLSSRFSKSLKRMKATLIWLADWLGYWSALSRSRRKKASPWSLTAHCSKENLLNASLSATRLMMCKVSSAKEFSTVNSWSKLTQPLPSGS